MDITIVPLTEEQNKPVPTDFAFGKTFANRMYLGRYSSEKGWYQRDICAYQPLSLDPATAVFHYGQELFEGTKAYRRADGNINLFRPIENMRRFNRSAKRVSMAQVEPEEHLDAIINLIKLEHKWVPEAPASLYIRPTLIAASPQLGLAASDEYIHFVIIGPVGGYFANTSDALSVWVETEYVRAVPGGTGDVKVGGNYAAAVYVSEQAKAKGYAQVLWLDGRERRYIEEVGAMNIAFAYGKERIVTPALSGSILPGITRDSILKLAPDLGYSVEEGRLDITEILNDISSGKITEAFGMGTAAVIAPIGKFGMGDDEIVVGTGAVGPIATELRQTLTDIQYGNIPDPYNWTLTIDVNSDNA